MALTRLSLALSALLITPTFAYPGSRLSFLEKRAVTAPTTLTYPYVGCVSDSVNQRTLSAAFKQDDAMTDEMCVSFCSANNYYYAGTEYAKECYCGNSLASGYSTEADSDCNMGCAGATSEACGGPNRLTLFSAGTAAPAGPVTNPGPGLWSSIGCYTDSAQRSLAVAMQVTGGANAMTVALCATACASGKYKYAGLEYAGECFCGNEFDNGGAITTDGRCDMPCHGNSSEYCGGSYGLTTYQFNVTKPVAAAPAWNALGCYTDTVAARTLSVGAQVPGGSQNMSQEACQSSCKSLGYTLAGVEYSGECYCDNQLRNGGGPASDGNAKCNMKCYGNTAEICGGPDRLTLFSYGVASAVSSSSSSSTVASSTSASVVASSSGSSTVSSSSAAATPSGWTSLGCYTDSVQGRTLATVQGIDGSTMTREVCQIACGKGGYKYAGVEYAAECYCGNTIDNGAGAATDGRCNMACKANANEICGGPNGLNLFQFGVVASSSSSSSSVSSTSSSSSSVASAIVSSSSSSSQVSSSSSSSVSSSSISSSSVSSSSVPVSSSSVSSSSGSSSSGSSSSVSSSSVSSSSSSSVSSSSVPISSSSFSSSVSSSSSSSSVSSSSVSSSSVPVSSSSSSSSVSSSSVSSSSVSSSSVSSSSVPVSSSSSSSSVSSSSVSSSSVPVSSSSSSSLISSSSVPTSSSSSSSSSSGSSSVPASITSSSSSSSASSSSSSSSSKASSSSSSSAISSSSSSSSGSSSSSSSSNVSSSSISSSASSSSSSSSSSISSSASSSSISSSASSSSASSSSSSSSSSSASPSATASSGFSYKGCWIDNYNNRGRSLLHQQPDNSTLTAESCISLCKGLGYTIAGLEYTTQCFCDNYVRNNATLSAHDSDCAMTCGGNSTEICGGPNLLSVYSSAPIVVRGVPTTQTTNLPGSWKYIGCIQDSVNGRLFPNGLIQDTTNNATSCLGLCSYYGYPAGGMEYGRECYCGDYSNAANAAVAPESDCNMVCSGDDEHLCGAGNRISYYEWHGTPLADFSYPTGSKAGVYENFVPGVVIPLITMQTIKKKVIFLEKSGTGAPNTTGAYELDPSLSNDFSKMWREMHVKTDIFCSAGLILPDRFGRQMTIGGWSADSTYGVRLYTPDGSAGVNGTNDWIETDAVQLQKGRWYPTAMIMANGSIIVVGGESGSNGPPVPYIELLPPQGPPLYMEWLQRTDPLNLYPFMAVLPSGGILAAYYNEAIILDEVTFATKRKLPMIPGGINEPQSSGRTYPLEGTMMLLPQVAPYTDPLGVLICGGSTNDGNALDNCVSIHPDVVGEEWLVERMPSKRVISCMTALPDGTFLIINGAHKGTAGFGLAEDENLNAVLYNPFAPKYTRMSVMANTTVARLYHSEAILMYDGRVLVTGSDPEDQPTANVVHPQEYRVEVFVPPYLLSGAAQPTFTIGTVDWSYGKTYTFTVTSSSGGAIRVSLLGSDASTHGNTMGQRTFFPAVSCSGNTCTVTAPPDSHTCPPGWFQMFVLDGPTPSHSEYVRIGGDPGSLGSWPTNSLFAPLPGEGPL